VREDVVQSDWDAIGSVAARLSAGGSEVTPPFVADVLRKYVELGGPDSLPVDPVERRTLARRVGSALYEDSDLVLRVLEQAQRAGLLGVGRAWAAAAGMPGLVRWVQRVLYGQVGLGALSIVVGVLLATGAAHDRTLALIESASAVLGLVVAPAALVLALRVPARQRNTRRWIIAFETAVLALLFAVGWGGAAAGYGGAGVGPHGLALALTAAGVLLCLTTRDARSWFSAA